MTTIKTEVITSKEGYEIWYSLDGGPIQFDSVHDTMDEAIKMTVSLKSHYNFVNMITGKLRLRSGRQ
jgi:hypothetical protein